MRRKKRKGGREGGRDQKSKCGENLEVDHLHQCCVVQDAKKAMKTMRSANTNDQQNFRRNSARSRDTKLGACLSLSQWACAFWWWRTHAFVASSLPRGGAGELPLSATWTGPLVSAGVSELASRLSRSRSTLYAQLSGFCGQSVARCPASWQK